MKNPESILVIDDDRSVQISFELALEGYNLTIASSGSECLKIIEKDSIDLLFIDLNMPFMNGVEVLKAIKEKNYDFPIFVLSGDWVEYQRDLDKLSASGLTFQVLQKPMTLEQIRSSVKQAFNSR